MNMRLHRVPTYISWYLGCDEEGFCEIKLENIHRLHFYVTTGMIYGSENLVMVATNKTLIVTAEMKFFSYVSRHNFNDQVSNIYSTIFRNVC
jgi:hypothetical protein